MPRQDPRRTDNPQGVNEQIQDRFIRHMLYLTRLASGEADWLEQRIRREYLPEIEDAAATAVNRLTGQPRSTVLTQEQSGQISQFAQGLAATSAALMTDIRTRHIDRIVEIARHEIQYELGLFREVIPVELNFSVPSDDQLRAILESQPFDGQPLSEWFSDLDTRTVQQVTREIRQGMVEGEDMDQIMRRIRGTRSGQYNDGVMQTTRHHAEAIARSGVMHASNQAASAMIRENDGLLNGVKVVITLDTRTCATCASKEAGNPYPVDNHPTPPFHPRCRCAIIPVLKSWRQLGIDLDESPAGTRASMDGQVPEDMTFNQWLRGQPREVVEEALGRERARLFIDGELDVYAFTDRAGRKFTLDDLRSREPEAFQRAGMSD